RNARTARDLGQREGRGLAVERLDHSQPSREGLDEVPAGRARSGGFVGRSHIETLALEHDREALPDADADRGDRDSPSAPPQLVRGVSQDAAAGGAERMPDREGTAVDVELLGVEIRPAAQAGE